MTYAESLDHFVVPVERPSKFDLLINLKTAKKLDITILPNVLVRATKVIRYA